MSKDTKKIISLVFAAIVFFALFALPVISKFVNTDIKTIKLAEDPDSPKYISPKPDKELLKRGAVPKSIFANSKKKLQIISPNSFKTACIPVLNIIGSTCSVISFVWAIFLWTKTRKRGIENG